MTVRQLDYKGITAWGTAAMGRTQSTPENLTKNLYDRGYRSARVIDVSTDEIVGEVCAEPDNPRRRTWWAER